MGIGYKLQGGYERTQTLWRGKPHGVPKLGVGSMVVWMSQFAVLILNTMDIRFLPKVVRLYYLQEMIKKPRLQKPECGLTAKGTRSQHNFAMV